MLEEVGRGVMPYARGPPPDSHKPVENKRFTTSGDSGGWGVSHRVQPGARRPLTGR